MLCFIHCYYIFLFIIFRTNMKLINEILNEEDQILINNVHDHQSVFKPNRTCKYPY